MSRLADGTKVYWQSATYGRREAVVIGASGNEAVYRLRVTGRGLPPELRANPDVFAVRSMVTARS